MSKKPWQKADQKSAFLMASWLFGANKSEKTAAAQGPPGNGDKAQSDVAKEQESSKADTAAGAVKEVNEQEVFPVEFVECFYSGDELEESQDGGNGSFHGQKLQGNAMKNDKGGSGKDVNVLKAENTIVA